MECGIDPGYVLDRMEWYEIEALIENIWMRNKESWEQARTIGYITAQCQSTKQLNPKDMMTFPWEKADRVEDTKEDIEDAYREMKEWEKIMNRQDN